MLDLRLIFLLIPRLSSDVLNTLEARRGCHELEDVVNCKSASKLRLNGGSLEAIPHLETNLRKELRFAVIKEAR